MKNVIYIFLYCLVANLSYGQNLYDTTHTKIFAQYLYNTQQYRFAAEEYSSLANNTFSNNLDYAFKAVECYSFIYDYNNAIDEFKKHILPIAKDSNSIYFDYVKLLIKNSNYATAHNYCDSIKAPYIIKSYNIKQCLSIIDNLPPTNNEELLLPEVKMLTNKELKQKKMFPAVTMSAILPGTGRIYCGHIREGITALLRTCFDYMHVAYGFHKYGFKDPYPLFFAAVSVCFYTGNIFGTVKSVKKYNLQQKHIRDAQIIDYMYNNLF